MLVMISQGDTFLGGGAFSEWLECLNKGLKCGFKILRAKVIRQGKVDHSEEFQAHEITECVNLWKEPVVYWESKAHK